MEGSKDQPKKSTAEEFARAYQDLCDKTGLQLIINPAYLKRDDGSYSTVLQLSVGEMPKEIIEGEEVKQD